MDLVIYLGFLAAIMGIILITINDEMDNKTTNMED